jgi:DNA-binding SARP family transcriptional activator
MGWPKCLIQPVNRLPDSRAASFLPYPAAVSSTRIPIGVPPELDPLLQAARTALARQELEQALHAYSHLTEHGRHLHEVTLDLAQHAQQFPRHTKVWKALGDVLTRAGNHEYATKAYEQFKKLSQ